MQGGQPHTPSIQRMEHSSAQQSGDKGKGPKSPQEYLKVVLQSHLVDEETLEQAYEEFKKKKHQPDATPLSQTATLAYYLIEEAKILTPWQSQMLLQGRYSGFILGKYKLLDIIGRGGMSKVFLAEHSLMHRRVAIKVLPKLKTESDSRLRRFLAECRMIAQFDHPNIVRAFHFDMEHDHYYLVMEFVEGKNLRQSVEREGALPYKVAADYIMQAARGLAHAHQFGLIHRDVKPANLLVDKSNIVKLLDLGLARSLNPESGASLTKSRQGKLVGTADYVAPEQVQDSHNVDPKTDIYSLGCTFYYLLTGHPPFPNGSLAEKLAMHLYHQPQNIKEKRPDVPDFLVAVCYKMMAKKPDDRFHSAKQVCDLLQSFLDGETIDVKEIFDKQQANQGSEQSDSVPHDLPKALSEKLMSHASSMNILPKEAIIHSGQSAPNPPVSATKLVSTSPQKPLVEARNHIDQQSHHPVKENGSSDHGSNRISSPDDVPTPSPLTEDQAKIDTREETPVTREPSKRPTDANLSSLIQPDTQISETPQDIKLPKPKRKKRSKRKRSATRDWPEIMTIEEVCEYLRISHEKMAKLIDEGRIPCQELDGEFRFLKSAVEEWLKEANFGTQTFETNRSYLTSLKSLIAKDRKNLNVGKFIESMATLELLPSQELEALIRGFTPEDLQEDADVLARNLADQGKLTDFQASSLLHNHLDHLRIGKYITLEKIGSGGMSVVYKAKHPNTEKIVAIKVLNPQEDSSEGYRRFENEVRAVSKLNHPNIVKAYDAVHEDGFAYLVMEYVDSQNLDQLIRRHGAIPVEKAIDYMVQIAEGLQHAHDNHIVHRDIKPGNLLLTRQGQIKILDLGLVRFDHALWNKSSNDPNPDRLTKCESLLGTPEFMAPEQFIDPRLADAKADIYSLGCTMFFMLTGKSPFARHTASATLKAHQAESPPLFSDSRSDIPIDLQHIFERMVSKDLHDRQETMQDVADELNVLLHGGIRGGGHGTNNQPGRSFLSRIFGAKQPPVNPIYPETGSSVYKTTKNFPLPEKKSSNFKQIMIGLLAGIYVGGTIGYLCWMGKVAPMPLLAEAFFGADVTDRTGLIFSSIFSAGIFGLIGGLVGSRWQDFFSKK